MSSMKRDARPNILFIMPDDHAAKAISCYGAGINNTPNLDRIAKEGMQFNHCYVTNSICTPSRASILTGTYNHVNNVTTLDSKLDRSLPNVAKHLRSSGYATGMFGKWHLGEGQQHQPSGFDEWEVVPGQGQYYDPIFIGKDGQKVHKGYVTDITTDKTIDFTKTRGEDKPFFVLCHHKAPHRPWQYDPKHKDLYKEPIALPDTFTDEYKNRTKAAAAAKMRVEEDMTYLDLGLVQPEGGEEYGQLVVQDSWTWTDRKVPSPEDVTSLRLIDKATGENFTFKTKDDLSRFKYQRYMQRYLRTIQSIDDNVGRLLDWLDQEGLSDNTMVIYTSDQGFFLGEHGWFDKRFMYEESFQMPFLVKHPRSIRPGTVCNDIISNVDFAATWLELARVRIPSYMQGTSFLKSLQGVPRPADDKTVAYHRYWMHRDIFHNAYAHYGCRNHRYKIIFWYNEGLNQPGTLAGGEEQEWELFDCQEDPLELFNVWPEPEYAKAREEMVRALEKKMEEIGDVPAHPIGLPAHQLAALYSRPAIREGLEHAKASQKNV